VLIEFSCSNGLSLRAPAALLPIGTAVGNATDVFVFAPLLSVDVCMVTGMLICWDPRIPILQGSILSGEVNSVLSVLSHIVPTALRQSARSSGEVRANCGP